MKFIQNLFENQKKHLLILAIAVTFIFIFVGKIDYSLPQYAEIDNLYYRTMADAAPGFTSDIIHPFVYRILGPWLAGIMPFHNDINFGILMYFSLIALTFAFYKFLILNQINAKIALITSMWVVFNKYIFGIMGFSYFQLCDSISVTALIMAFVFFYKNNWLGILISSVIGILAKETILLFYIPALIYLFINKHPKKEIINCILSGAVTFAIFIALRMIFSPSEEGDYLIQLGFGVSKFFNLTVWVRQLSNVFLPFSLIFIIFLKELFQFSKKEIYLTLLFILTIISSLFGLDCERLMLPGILFSYLFFAQLAEKYLLSEDGKFRWNFTFVITCITLISNLYHLWGLVRLPSRTISIYLTIILNVIILGIFVYLKYFDKRKTETTV